MFSPRKQLESTYELDDIPMASSSFSHSTAGQSEIPSDYLDERMSRSRIGRILQNLGWRDGGPHGQIHEEYLLPKYGALDDILPVRIRRSQVRGCLKRAIVALPALLLMLFGVIHVLEVIVGRSNFLWNVRIYAELRGTPKHLDHSAPPLTDAPASITRGVLPKPCHSHDDFRRAKPLFDALAWGCISVEADIWEFDGELYVGHGLNTLAHSRTLRSLYIDPLANILDGMEPSLPLEDGSHRGIFSERPEQMFTLLVDFKSSGGRTFSVLQEQLEPLRRKGYLTHWNGTDVVPGAIIIVGSGRVPFESVVANSTYRDIFFDAPLDHLWEPPRLPIKPDDDAHSKDSKVDYGEAMALAQAAALADGPAGREVMFYRDPFNTTNSYTASVNFQKAVGFVWRGHLSPRQMATIRGQIRGARRHGLKVRYWGTPSWPIELRNHVWHVLVKEGADLLDVNDLETAASWEWTAGFRQW